MTLPHVPLMGTLANLRKQGFTELFLAMEQPNVIFTCQVNQTFTTHDRVAEVTYDNPTGDYTDVRPGMTAYVGSTAGARDLGLVRVRKAPTSSILYIGEGSEVDFDDNVWLTVVDQFAIWPKHIRIDNRIAYMDWDEAYSDQHSDFDPVPVLGGHRVAWLQPIFEEISLYSSASASYVGSWSVAPNPYPSKYSSTTGNTCTFSFIGSRIRLYITKADNQGQANIYIDDVLIETVDGYAASIVASALAFDSGVIAQGEHTLKIEIAGTKNPSSSGYYFSLVTFDVISDTALYSESTVDFDGSESWVYGGSISSVRWIAPGSASISAPTATSTTISWDAAGQYMVYLELTASNGKIFTAARRVFIFDDENPPLSNFSLDECRADIDDGGWSFSVSTKSVQAAQIVERNLCILFARDYFDNEEISYGPLEGHETIVASGWVGKNSMEYDANTGSVSFDVYGPQYWLKQMAAFPTGIELAPRTPTAWTEMKEMTVDKGVWHILHWRSTCTIVLDYIPQLENVQYVKELSASTGTIWQQINTFAWTTIFSRLLFNRYSQGFLAVDPQLVPEASRTWETWSLPKQDIRGGIRVSASNRGSCSMVNLSGVCINLSGSASAFFSLSMGHVYTRVGRPEIVDKLLVIDQAQSNSLAGLVMGMKNNDLSSIQFDCMRNNRYFDIAPRMFLVIQIEAGDTPRGITFDGNTLIKHVDLSHENGVLRPSLEVEAETFEQLSTDGDIPDSPADEDVSIPPPPPPPELPPLEVIGEPIEVCFADDTYGFLYTLDFDSDSPTWFLGNTGLDAYEQEAIDRLEVSLFTGRIYIAALGMQKIWTALAAGGAWQLVADRQMILDMSFPGWEDIIGWTFHFKAFGMNQNAPDEIALIAGRTSTPYTSDNYLYLGGATGIEATNPTPFYSKGGSAAGDITFGNGKWLYTGLNISLFFNTALFRFPDGGGDLEYVADLPTTAGYTPYHARAGTGDVVFHHQADHANLITGDGGTVTDLGLNDLQNWEQAAEIDPSGTVIMAAKGANGRQVSTDGGGTWSDLTALPYTGSERFKFHNCLSPDRWIAGHTGIYYTPDQGVTWVDKTGNLLELLPNLEIKVIRVMRYGEQA